MWKALHQKDHHGLIETIQENQSLLSEIKVVGSRCKEVCETMRKLGVDAAKITGAGSGGFVLGLLPTDKNKADASMAELKRYFGNDAVIDTDQQINRSDSEQPSISAGIGTKPRTDSGAMHVH